MMRTLALILLIFMLCIVGIGSFFVFGSYSEGFRAGRLMKLSKKGYIFKTYEGQLDIGGLQSNATKVGGASTVWEFSVKDDKVIEDMNKAVDDNAEVKLYYEEKYYTFWFWGDTKYFVTKVEETKPKQR
jgi:hypothetical protein